MSLGVASAVDDCLHQDGSTLNVDACQCGGNACDANNYCIDSAFCSANPITYCFTVELWDSYGDGWTGNKIIFKSSFGENTVTLEDGYRKEYTWCNPLGFEWGAPGSWPGDVSIFIGKREGSSLTGNKFEHGDNKNCHATFQKYNFISGECVEECGNDLANAQHSAFCVEKCPISVPKYDDASNTCEIVGDACPKYQLWNTTSNACGDECEFPTPDAFRRTNECRACPNSLPIYDGDSRLCNIVGDTCAPNQVWDISANECGDVCVSPNRITNRATNECQACPANSPKYDTDSMTCNIVGDACLVNQVWNTVTNDCETCASSTPKANRITNECEACPTDYVYDDTTHICVAPLNCGSAFIESNDQCLPRCAAGETWNGNACQAACESNTFLFGDECRYSLTLRSVHNTSYFLESNADVTAYDLNKDGRDDILLALSNGDIKYFQNEGDTFVETKQTIVPNTFASPSDSDNVVKPYLTFGDVDNDGIDELVVFTKQSDTLLYYKKIGAFYQQMVGDANIFKNILINNARLYYPVFVDIDGDGHLDLSVGQPSGIISIYSMQEDGFFDFIPINSYTYYDVGEKAQPAFYDVDGDGDLDLFNSGPDGLSLHLNVGTYYQKKSLFLQNRLSDAQFDTLHNYATVGDFQGTGVRDLLVRHATHDGDHSLFIYSVDTHDMKSLDKASDEELQHEYTRRADNQC